MFMSSPSRAQRTLIIGLSGPSTSGKTTLARLLRTIFDIPSPAPGKPSIHLKILHQDDFYKTDSDLLNYTRIPTVTTPTNRVLQDWDCAESLDLPLLSATIRHISTHGTLPANLQSKEDQNEPASNPVPGTAIQAHSRHVRDWFSSLSFPPDIKLISLCILDGFLLYPDPHASHPPQSLLGLVGSLLYLKLFLRSTYALTKSRREARSGYVTLEGFWEDPPGYVDEVVWPNYLREHAWMFEGGDVDQGALTEEVGRQGIFVGPGKGEKGMGELLDWAVGVLTGEIDVMVHGG